MPSAPGRPPTLDLLPYYIVDNRAVTVASRRHEPGFRSPAGQQPPAPHRHDRHGRRAGAAPPGHRRSGPLCGLAPAALLEARGVRVTGNVAARHRPLSPGRPCDAQRRAAARPPLQEPLARLDPPPLAEDLRLINKASQNLHAELMLRRLGRQNGTGSIADGLAVVRAMLERAGVRRAHYDFSDGSGMSTYNRLSRAASSASCAGRTPSPGARLARDPSGRRRRRHALAPLPRHGA